MTTITLTSPSGNKLRRVVHQISTPATGPQVFTVSTPTGRSRETLTTADLRARGVRTGQLSAAIAHYLAR
jgi:hypothetical protein